MYEEFFDYDEETIRILENNVKAELPDPFLFSDGTRVKTGKDWDLRHKEIYKTAVELQYGTIPPKPEVFRVEPTYYASNACSYRIIAGTKEKQLTFYMRIARTDPKMGPKPVIINGDGCWNYAFDGRVPEILKNDLNFIIFDRTQIADDVTPDRVRKGAIYDIYPEYTFGAIAAWAWGFSRCLDALEKIGGYDLSLVTFTGHSRGAKAAMLAGVLDERATIVNPNATCQGGCSSYRISMKALTEEGDEKVSETLSSLSEKFDFWIGPSMKEYIGREETLPFDSHFLKALVAPRILLIGDAASDIWANPIGTWQTSMAAAEIYKFLGCEENLIWYFRRGHHQHARADIDMLLNVIRHVRDKEPLSDRFYKTPFKRPLKAYSWECPK